MNISKLLVVVAFAGALFGVGAMQRGGLANNTKLTDQKTPISIAYDYNGNSPSSLLRSIVYPIIEAIFRNPNKPGSINITIPASPNTPSLPPSPSGGLEEIAPSPVPEGGVTNDTEAPLSGGIIGFAPSPVPEGGVTEAPLSGGIIEFSPSPLPEAPLSGGNIEFAPSPLPEAPLSGGIIGVAPVPVEGLAPGIGAPIGVIVGVSPAPESEVPFTTNTLDTKLIINAIGNEDGSDGWMVDMEP